MTAIFRAVAVTAFALPTRAARRRKKAPSAVADLPDADGCHPKQYRRPIRGASSPRAEDLAARYLVARREREPGGEVLRSSPPAHVGAALGDDSERGVRAEAVDLREVHATDERVKRISDLEAGLVLRTTLAPCLGQGDGRRLALIVERLQTALYFRDRIPRSSTRRSRTAQRLGGARRRARHGSCRSVPHRWSRLKLCI